ncbi:cytochrome c maturation protein CcmE [Ferrimonas sediminicola]|uniref:Cytochrome c-type biogenesis protein CcmE n=1 Tax=Ferrimonas sediminicola TaxID=2569538 RepID=A0A4U1B7I8_9GAMM|nr:cytochrome c maturation protein CcmE [Ferrimonas sediminicola]TKB46562.1 cytochrome c maturation protein CcmE [Ferrimonas sediminicola]
MNPRRKKRLLFASALIGGVAAIASLLLYALNSNLDLFYTASEIHLGKEGTGIKPEIGQRIRIGGMVVPGSVKRDPDSLKVEFQIADTGPAVTIRYDGMLPDLFREGQGIVAQGPMTEFAVIDATEVLAKHDENYMPPEVAEAMGKKHEKLTYDEPQVQGGSY